MRTQTHRRDPVRQRHRHQLTDKHCPAGGCRSHIPPRHFSCRAHWYQLPPSFRREVWSAYLAGKRRITLDLLERAHKIWRGKSSDS